MAKELLDKESINLPEIMKILGDRPYPLKESIREYLEELEKRRKEEAENKEIEDAKAAMTDAAAEEQVDDPAAPEENKTSENDPEKEAEDER